MTEKTVFVTVGTTSFDRLVKTVCSSDICQILKSLGYTKEVLQIGRGTYEPKSSIEEDFSLQFFRYKDSIKADIENASLVISHAGAGSVLETLEAGKHMIVVINEELMNNHQLELANQMYKDGHLYYCTCSELGDLMKSMDLSQLKPLKPGKPELFGKFLNNLMGVDS
ncbi:UDP-N-acetylglucosamine transferase subunit ALG13-like isoform X2 [Tubulanus polymorphus]|uniref:UDP-N-acetylglucosamine transferase subunit ALG13-like isoform X2 n=1 Tax=Tubulanus polymorphus TaxID=672921 RepID=UPI003DA2749C